jgi:hypothetical protein
MNDESTRRSDPPRLGLKGTFDVLWPYVREKFVEQVKSIWFIIFYLCVFQIVVLKLPVVYAGMIGAGIFIVALGLMFFMEGLRLGLMPFGEIIGAVLPRNSGLPTILGFAFILGLGATFAEPALSVLKAAGAGVLPDQAPLLYSLLNDYAGQLVACVGAGVGVAVALGVLRFFNDWSLKALIIPSVVVLSVLTLWAQMIAPMSAIVGLAWDCGAVTTGPVTVPLVLALGIGVCRIVGGEDTRNAGFGIVTLASLFPILAVLLLGFYHHFSDDYYGRPNHPEEFRAQARETLANAPQDDGSGMLANRGYTKADFVRYKFDGKLPPDYELSFQGGAPALDDQGRIVHTNAVIVLQRARSASNLVPNEDRWDPDTSFVAGLVEGFIGALRAIVPLCLFLFVTLRVILKERVRQADEISVGIVFAVVGMTLFGLGITLGLTPLGGQLGFNIPASFAEITPWRMEAGAIGPLFSEGFGGKLVAIAFGFFLGYGATLAEPALNALGGTVEKITVGAFKKSLLMQSVALGVAMGIAAGVFKIAYNIPLTYILLPPYLALIALTVVSTEEFVNFGWDSAGVTTGPITVPLVLAMGLGIGGSVPGVIDGFGILALASVGPIITVLSVGLIVRHTSGESKDAVEPMEAADE